VERLSHILARLMHREGLESSATIHVLARKWKEIVGEELATRCWPSCVKKKILTVKVSSPTWMQEIHFHKVEILRRVKEVLGPSKLDDIRFTTRGSKPAPIKGRPGLRAVETWDLDERERLELEGKISSIPDEKLRPILRKILAIHVAPLSRGTLPSSME